MAAAMVVALAGCGSPAVTAPQGSSPGAGPTATVSRAPTATASPSAGASADRVAGWRSDLESLVPAMAAIHPSLSHGTPRPMLEAAVGVLEAAIPIRTDDQLMVDVLRIVAMVSAKGCDGHTGAFIWGTGTYPVESLPLRLWWFPEGLVVVDALAPYRDLVGSRVDTIAGRPTAEVLAAIDPLVPRDNEATVRLVTPRYLLIPQVLRGLGIAGPGAVTLGLTPAQGSASTVDVAPIPMADYNAWAGPYGLHLPIDPKVPYLARIGDALWWQPSDDGQTLFVQWNRVEHQDGTPLEQLRVAMHQKGLARIVLDIRHNYGGEVAAMNDILDLFQDPAVDRTGRLFVITGRNTFSAASMFLARLDARTSAIVVGEPMGGCPTLYGNSADVDLPFSGIAVSVASTFEVGVSADDHRPTIEPELPAPLTVEAWRAGIDPAMAAILAYRP